MGQVGIIANPESGKDIRRIAASGSVTTTSQKVNSLTRLLKGIAAGGIREVLMMPDSYGIGAEARAGLMASDHSPVAVNFLEMNLTGKEDDSYRAALLMKELNVDCLVTMGGDGTSRLVAKGCGDIPMIPISSGTNNVFPSIVETTVAGMAAAITADRRFDPAGYVSRRKKLEIRKNGETVDLALVDAAVTLDDDIGSKAIWDMANVRQIVQTCASPAGIGLSSIGGAFHSISNDDPLGLSVELGAANFSALAIIGPGLVKEVDVESVRILKIGESVQVKHTPSFIALDGERKIRVHGGDEYDILLSSHGPNVVDVAGLMKLVADSKAFVR